MSPAPASVAEEVVRELTANQRLVAIGRDWDIGSRRSRTRARNDLRHLRLLYSEGNNPTPLGLAVRALLKDQEQ